MSDLIHGTANLRASHGQITTDWDPADAQVTTASRDLIDGLAELHNDMLRDLERARAIAVSLEQELAKVTEERDLLLRDLVHEVTVEADPWANAVIPDDWQTDD